jgi:hypothetical protein
MFETPDSLATDVELPVLVNFRFKPESHVAGLGITVGSCFIGIPLFGIPVEERSVAIRPVVCANPGS